MSLFKRLGEYVRGIFGLFIGRLEERNPDILFEDIENQVKKMKKEMEQKIIDIQTNAELIKIDMENAEKNLRDIEKKIKIAQMQGNKDILVELLIKEDEYKSIYDAYKNTHDRTVMEVAKAKEEYMAFVSEIKARSNELKVLKSKAKIAMLRENINSANSGYASFNNMIGGINTRMDRAREIVDEKNARANAIESLVKENVDMKVSKLDMDVIREKACIKAESMLNEKKDSEQKVEDDAEQKEDK